VFRRVGSCSKPTVGDELAFQNSMKTSGRIGNRPDVSDCSPREPSYLLVRAANMIAAMILVDNQRCAIWNPMSIR